MTTNTLTVPSTVDALIGAYRSHVLGRTLPAPAYVTFDPSELEIQVQPEGGLKLTCKLSNVLVWAYTLVEASATWSHTDGGRLHVTVTGRTAGGARLRVYGGGEFGQCRGLVALAAGESEGVSLDEVYALVGLLRETQDQREVA